MADVHIWDGKMAGVLWKNIHTNLYLTLCGVHVGWNELAYDGVSRPIEPTCMGCILVRFQHEAEEQDGA
jgi:hypothetical protein